MDAGEVRVKRPTSSRVLLAGVRPRPYSLKEAVAEASRGTLKQVVARHKKRLKAKYSKGGNGR
jgi:hypothetical protein